MRGLAVAAAAFLVVLAAPLAWLAAGRIETLDDSVAKFALNGSGSLLLDRLTGLSDFLVKALAYCGPLLGVALAAAILARLDGRAVPGAFGWLKAGARYLVTAIGASFAMALLLVLASGTTVVKGYWFHPILITLPAAVAAFLEVYDRTGWANRLIVLCGALLALASVLAFVLRIPGLGA